MPYIFARTERKLEWYCKIKDNDLRFEWMSLWVSQFVSWCVRELLVFREIISWWFDMFCTSCLRRVFVLCWHHRENKRLLMDRNIKSQEDFILWVVCDTAKVRFFKQITSGYHCRLMGNGGAHGLLHLLWGVGDVSAICLALIIFSC